MELVRSSVSIDSGLPYVTVKGNTIHESEMALFSECMLWCA